jgi:hypothetical protein
VCYQLALRAACYCLSAAAFTPPRDPLIPNTLMRTFSILCGVLCVLRATASENVSDSVSVKRGEASSATVCQSAGNPHLTYVCLGTR